MKRVFLSCPNPNDGTSFYRGAGPFTSLERKGHIEIVTAGELDWPTIKFCDILFFQRPQSEETIEAMEKAKKLGKRVWIDFDDLLTQMPDSNPNCNFYWREEVQQAIMNALAIADVVTVSTQSLADAIKPYIKGECVVIPNAWDDDLLPFPKWSEGTHEGPKRLLWRGSRTHDEDLMSVLLSLEHLAKTEDKAEWYFIGDPFWLALRHIKKYRSLNVKPWTDISDYFHTLTYTHADAMLVPLCDNPFNRAKSNIAWLEATWSGALTIAPNWDEWKKPGVLNYTNNFKDLVKAVIHNEIDIVAQHKASWDYIDSELRLSKINQMRLDIIDKIT